MRCFPDRFKEYHVYIEGMAFKTTPCIPSPPFSLQISHDGILLAGDIVCGRGAWITVCCELGSFLRTCADMVAKLI